MQAIHRCHFPQGQAEYGGEYGFRYSPHSDRGASERRMANRLHHYMGWRIRGVARSRYF